MKLILITGGAGFIGSHLAAFLHALGHSIVCMDDLYTGRRRNLESLDKSNRFSFIEHDVRKPYDVKCDEIYNMACPASPIHYSRDPIRTLTTNTDGALHALENADRYNATVLQASTSEVYGDPKVSPQGESYRGEVNCIGPRACYDEGKRCAESLFFDFHRMKGVRIRVARIFNTYGPMMTVNDGRVISNFIISALSDENLTIYGSGMQTRSFCFVADLIDGLVRLMEHNSDSPVLVNLGNPRDETIRNLAQIIIELCGSKSEISYHPLPEDDPKQRCPDIRLAESLLGWKPTIDLEEGLARTISYYRKSL